MTTEEEAQNLFQTTLEYRPNAYYKVLAIERLGLSGEELNKVLFSVQEKTNFKNLPKGTIPLCLQYLMPA